MKCKSVRRKLALYAGEELTDASRSAIEAHLKACAECRALVEELQTDCQALGSLKDNETDKDGLADLRARIHTAIAEVEGERSGVDPTRVWFRVGYGLVLAALLLAVGLLVWQMSFPHELSPDDTVAMREPTNPLSVQAPSSGPEEETVLASAATEQDREPMMVKFYTDNPDIVIIWLTD